MVGNVEQLHRLLTYLVKEERNFGGVLFITVGEGEIISVTVSFILASGSLLVVF